MLPDSMRPFKVLVADDDPEWRRLLELWLEPAGYRLFFVSCGKDVVSLAEHHRPDCILLDFELGDQTALEVCRDLRSKACLDAVPIIILTSHAEEKLHAYRNCQADHFVVKDGRNPEEVLAVLEATFRRMKKDRKVLEKGDIRLDPEGCGVYLNGRLDATLSREQFIFLYTLVQRSPEVVSHDEIFKLVLHEHFPGDNTEAIRSLVRRLRTAVGRSLMRRIKSVKGVGWLYHPSSAQVSSQPQSAVPAKSPRG